MVRSHTQLSIPGGLPIDLTHPPVVPVRRQKPGAISRELAQEPGASPFLLAVFVMHAQPRSFLCIIGFYAWWGSPYVREIITPICLEMDY